MTRKPRYTLLILGILFFTVAAPTLVLYVQGKLPLFGNRRMQPTGIISVASDPSGADVYVNGTQEDTTPTAIRFLPTGDYIVHIHKNGYWDWQKRLSVVAGHVTYTNPNPEKQVLLKRDTPVELAQKVDLYTTFARSLVYTQGLTFTFLPNPDEPDRTTKVTLPAQPAELITTDESPFIGVRSTQATFLLNPDGHALTDITKQIPGATHITLTKTHLLALTPDRTFVALPFSKLTAKPVVLAPNVYAFHTRDSDIYYIQKNIESSGLHHATMGTNGLEGDQLLAEKIPTQAARIYVDSAKAVFVQSADTLYRINAQAEAIATGVANASDQTGTLSYITAGELWWYDSNSNTARLVSRSGEGFTESVVQPSLQYALFAQGKHLVALELDDRGEQNRYVLDTTDRLTNLQLLNSEFLTYLADDSLHILTLR